MKLRCWLVGHDVQSFPTGEYFRHGRRRRGYDSRCARCDADSSACYHDGAMERNLRAWTINAARRLDAWRLTICTDCRKPSVQFCHHVGDHARCEEIPF